MSTPGRTSSSSNPHIPPAAAALLHKSYERPKNRAGMFRLHEASQRADRERQKQDKQKWLFEPSSSDDNFASSSAHQPPSALLQNPTSSSSSNRSTPTPRAATPGKQQQQRRPQQQKNQQHQQQDSNFENDVTPIQRLPFRSLTDVLAPEFDGDGGDGDGDSQARRRRDEEVRRLLAAASGRSTVHRTWKAVEEEQEHEKRSRAIKRTFLTARQTPPPTPVNHPRAAKRPEALLDDEQDENDNNTVDPRSRSDPNAPPPRPNRTIPTPSRGCNAGCQGITPFSSRVTRMEQSLEKTLQKTRPGASAAAKRQLARRAAAEDAVDSLGAEQRLAEERAKARFMAEVMKRRQVQEQERTMVEDAEARDKKRRMKHQQQQAAAAADDSSVGVVTPSTPRRKQRGSGGGCRGSGVMMSHMGEMMGALSPVGVMAKALRGLPSSEQWRQPGQLFAEGTDSEDCSEDDEYSNDVDDGDASDEEQMRRAREKLKRRMENQQDDDDDDDGDRVRRAKNLWQFATSSSSRSAGQQSKNAAGDSKKHDELLLESSSEHQSRWDSARARIRLAALFGQVPPDDALAELEALGGDTAAVLDLLETPGAGERSTPKTGDVVNPFARGGGAGASVDGGGGDEFGKLFGAEGGRRRAFGGGNNANNDDTAGSSSSAFGGGKFFKINRQRVHDIIRGIEQQHRNPDMDYVDPGDNGIASGSVAFPMRNGDQKQPSEEDEAAYRRRRAAAWRRRAANLVVENGIGAELANQYWSKRMSWVDAEMEELAALEAGEVAGSAEEDALSSRRASPSPSPSQAFGRSGVFLSSSTSSPSAVFGGGASAVAASSKPAAAVPAASTSPSGTKKATAGHLPAALESMMNARKMAEAVLEQHKTAGAAASQPAAASASLSSSSLRLASTSNFASVASFSRTSTVFNNNNNNNNNNNSSSSAVFGSGGSGTLSSGRFL